MADQLAKEAANVGVGVEVEVDVPRAFTSRLTLAKEQTWRVRAQEWRDLEHGPGLDMGEDKVYLRFASTLDNIKEATESCSL